jgi:hypothetical protein
LRMPCSLSRTVRLLGSMHFHLLQHCFFVRPGTSAEIATQSLPPCICAASAFYLRLLPVYPYVQQSGRCLDSRYHAPSAPTLFFFVRPRTSMATATQSLSPCIFTSSFNFFASSSDHLPVRSFAPSMLGFKALYHLSRH